MPTDQSRAERLKAALRENLKRRKAPADAAAPVAAPPPPGYPEAPGAGHKDTTCEQSS